MQLALIVDDSKTARVMLRKMLDRLHIPVAMVESAEDALDYLQNNHPDVIFMDHMMPGMDGFSAVKAIKSDPEKSTIPIIMHTTKQGDMYLGQARALGAADILAKPATDQTLVDVLERVKGCDLFKTVENPIITDAMLSRELLSQPQSVAVTDGSQSSGLGASLSSFFGSTRQWLLALVWAAPIAWLLVLHFQQQHDLQQLQEQRQRYLASLEWLLNQQSSYDYGEAPMAGERLLLLKGLVSRLEQTGFSGTIRLEGHTGEFCLLQVPLQDGSEVTMLPRPELPLTECDVIGSSQARAREISIQQSEEFQRYRQQIIAEGNIDIELLAYGTANPQYSYPIDLLGVSSGDWNAVALNNNRVVFSLMVR